MEPADEVQHAGHSHADHGRAPPGHGEGVGFVGIVLVDVAEQLVDAAEVAGSGDSLVAPLHVQLERGGQGGGIGQIGHEPQVHDLCLLPTSVLLAEVCATAF